MYSNAQLEIAASRCAVKLREAGLKVSATVWDTPRAMDLALHPTAPGALVVRCVARVTDSDYRALRAMLSEGDFDRAVLVYCDAEQPDVSDEIESWPIADIEKLAASLSRGDASS